MWTLSRVVRVAAGIAAACLLNTLQFLFLLQALTLALTLAGFVNEVTGSNELEASKKDHACRAGEDGDDCERERSAG
jgi:hypothetical protein